MKKSDYHLIDRMYCKCPFCNSVHIIECRWRFANKYIDGQVVRYKERFYRCLARAGYKENEFIPEELQAENDRAAKMEYQQILNEQNAPLVKCCRNCGAIVGYNSWFHGYYCSFCHDLERIEK